MKGLKFYLSLLAVCGILLRPQAAVTGAQAAMRQWFSSVAPALFPFLALMPALTSREACAVYEAVFGRVMRPLLGLPGSAAPAVIIGMISGSPGGALAVSRIAAQTGMSADQASRIALAVCGLSPAYLILGVGQGVCGSVQAGVRLAGLQAAVQLLLLFILEPFCRNVGGKTSPPAALQAEKPIRSAVETVLAVGGCMVFFSTIASVAAAFTGERVGRVLLLAMDLPSGLPALMQWETPLRSLLLGMGVGFGGLCIASQNLDALGAVGVSMGRYLAVRIAAALMMGILTSVLLPVGAAPAGLRFHTKNAYALSLLAAMFALVPVLIKITKKFILNKENFEKSAPQNS